jgi:hypothetical protein
MNDNYGQHGNEGPEHKRDTSHPPYWRRAHRDWRVWVALVFCMTAITIYVLSDDLALLPRRPLPQTQTGAVGK